MKSRLQQRMLQTIARHGMLAAGETLGVGVSGGADSVALLLLLEELRERLGIRLLVMHFNHGLRGAASDADQRFVEELAASRGLECVTAREDVAGAAREHAWNIEDAARRLRYRFFSQVIETGRATRVALGHTADDQAETVLAHLVRGTGPTGLAAIYPVAGSVVRPLLAVRRQELRDYLVSRGQAWRDDETNQDTSRLRARIRERLVPLLEREFHFGVVARLGRLAGLAREEEAFWEALVAERSQALVERAGTSLTIRIPDLLAPLSLGSCAQDAVGPANPHSALTKRLVRRIFEELKGDRRELTARHVEQVLHLATRCPSGHRMQLPSGTVVERSFDRLIFTRVPRETLAAETSGTRGALIAFQHVVELGSRGWATVAVPEIGRRFHLKVIDWPPPASETSGRWGTLDRDLLRAPLVIRNWRPGDSYRPIGRQHVRKLKRLLLESRVARREREGWPVLTSAGALVWARGLPVAAEYAPHEGTRAGVVIAEDDL